MFTLMETGVPVSVFNLLAAILQENKIIIDDEAAEPPSLTQTIGLAQRTTVSPPLLSILLKAQKETTGTLYVAMLPI